MTVAIVEKMKHMMLLMQVKQTKTAAKLSVAEMIMAVQRMVKPQPRSAQLGRKAARRMCHILASITTRTRGTMMQKTQTNSHHTPQGLTILPRKMTIMRARELKIISRRPFKSCYVKSVCRAGACFRGKINRKHKQEVVVKY
ncbi:hypothetical protein INR49_013584 [Caranx melampygus]|nr:hypothetical protein INR49_013584 [Caranx melampygus]